MKRVGALRGRAGQARLRAGPAGRRDGEAALRIQRRRERATGVPARARRERAWLRVFACSERGWGAGSGDGPQDAQCGLAEARVEDRCGRSAEGLSPDRDTHASSEAQTLASFLRVCAHRAAPAPRLQMRDGAEALALSGMWWRSRPH